MKFFATIELFRPAACWQSADASIRKPEQCFILSWEALWGELWEALWEGEPPTNFHQVARDLCQMLRQDNNQKVPTKVFKSTKKCWKFCNINTINWRIDHIREILLNIFISQRLVGGWANLIPGSPPSPLIPSTHCFPFSNLLQQSASDKKKLLQKRDQRCF